MSETLWDKAVRSYNVAVMIYNAMGDDEAYLNNIGYNLQQSVEMAIKYLLEQNGVEYPKTHDIDQLIRLANVNGADLHLTEYMEEHGEMFSLWESRTRYVLDYQLEKDKVEKAMNEVKLYLDGVVDAETKE